MLHLPGLVLCLAAASAIACGSRAKPVRLGDSKPAAVPSPGPRVASGEPELLLGALCPAAAAGRPAVRPLFMRAGIWRPADESSDRLVAARSARQFSILSWRGERVGILAVAGAAKTGGTTMAVGSYAGAMPCDDDDGKPIAACVRALDGCGLALARLEPSAGLGARPFEEDPEPAAIETRPLCLDEGELALDVDGDGSYELFPAAKLGGSLPAELTARGSAPRSCDDRGARSSGAHSVLVTAADVDSDGRVELVVTMSNGSQRTWALYRSLQTPARLERVALIRYSAQPATSAGRAAPTPAHTR